jgi:hypothetical protein
MANYPTSLDSLANPTSAQYTDDPGFELDLVVGALNDIAEALENKVGIGATTPDATQKTVKATAAGTSAWGYYGLVNLGEVSASGSSAVMEIASIPAGFRHLQLYVIGKSTSGGVGGVAGQLTFESSPTAGTYNYQQLSVNNTSVSAAQNVGTSDYIDVGLFPTDGAHSSLFGSAWVTIMEYANTGLYKNTVSLNAGHNEIASGGLHQRNASGLWESTAAISRVRVTASTGNWKSGSKMSLFGVPV